MRSINMSGSEIKLSIIMPTYNREAYIREALDSILMQESNYPYEIIIADDCSTDDSLKIAQEYQARNPNKIKILPSSSNQKLFNNIVRVYADLKSDYFCILDPDDFWTDKHKIQKALDFLESHQDYVCYHADILCRDENGKEWRYFNINEPRTTSFESWLKGKAIIPCSLGSVFRNVIFKNGLPKALANVKGTQEVSFRADSFRSFAHLHEGKFYYYPEVDSVYRQTSSGLWTTASLYERSFMGAAFYKDMWFYFDKQYLEMLVFSQREYRKYSPLKYLQKLRERESSPLLIERIQQCEELEKLYEENLSSINAKIYQKTKLKYKIFLWIYDKLRKKLSKKGLIVWGL